MKQILLLIFMAFLSGVSFSQGAFHRLYGGDHFDYGYDIVELPDSGFFVTGMSGSYTPGHAEAFLMKLDKNGNKEWILPYGGVENDASLDLEFKENFGTYLLGRTTATTGGFDVWIALVDDLGTVQWERTYPGDNWEEAVESAMTQDNGLVVGVHRFGNGTEDQDATLLRLDAQGDTVWVQEYDAPGNDAITVIKQYQDSLFVITSNHHDATEDQDFSLLQVIHEDGSLVWDDTIGVYPGNSYFNDFYLTGDTLYGVGTFKLDDTSTYNRMRHVHRLSLEENGDISTDMAVSLSNNIDDVVTPAYGLGFIYSSFRFEDPSASTQNYDFYIGLNNLQLVPISAAANTATEGNDRLYEGIPTADSGAVFVGYQSISTGATAVVVMKVGKNFNYPIIQENPLITPILNVDELQSLAAVAMYPNPAEDKIQIQLGEVNADAYRLISLDGKMQQYGVLDKQLNTISVADLNTGVYLIQVYREDQLLGVRRLVVK